MNRCLLNWKEAGAEGAPSLKEFFQETKDPRQEKIARYLDRGKTILTAPGVSVDFFSGESIENRLEIMTDGEYSWVSWLSYYVRKYNLKLPEEFIEKVMRTCG